MKKIFLIFVFYFLTVGLIWAETKVETQAVAPEQAEVVVPKAVEPEQLSTGNVTFDFKEADIINVLKIISFKSGINIVTTPDVIGNVSVRLTDVPWEIAMDIILKTYGFGYQRQGNVILVTKMENVAKIAAEEPLQIEIITLKYLDAQDAQKIIIPLLSPRGKISVLYTRGQKGWKFGTFKIGKDATSSAALAKEAAGPAKTETVSFEKNAAGETIMKKAEFDPSVKSMVLVITDTASTLDRIRNVILPKIDIKPKQVLVETKFMEVNKTKLKDLGVDWGFGSHHNAESANITTQTTNSGNSAVGGHGLGTALGALIAAGSTNPYAAGGEFVFQKLTGTEFEAIVHALEDDTNTNTLSAPSILTLDNQEASMLVGYHTPILQSTVTAGTDTTGATVTQTLDYYQEIGIRLNVVPQISEEGFINMIIHPSITSSSDHIDATSTAGSDSTVTSYPIIDVREAQTQVMLRDGETIVIGGLLKDVKTKTKVGIPFLVNLPWVGKFFGRDEDNVEKIDLLIFITARIIKDDEYTPEELAKLQKRLGQPVVVDLKRDPSAKKKKK